MNYILSRVLEFFPDRLATAKWQCRFQTTGLEHIQEARKKGRSVVLTCFHFGSFKLIPYWLRALGIPTIGILRGSSGTRSRAKRMKDKLSPFPGIPTVLYNEDQLRSALSLLSAGKVLLLAADREVGKQVTVRIDDHWSFQMATGAIRLASHCDAELIPCCMTDEGHWHFRFEIGRPAPTAFLAPNPDMMSAGQHILQELLPGVRRHPEQCGGYLLDCFRPNVLIPGQETSVV